MARVHDSHFPEAQRTILVGVQAGKVAAPVPFGAAELAVTVLIGPFEITSDTVAAPRPLCTAFFGFAAGKFGLKFLKAQETVTILIDGKENIALGKYRPISSIPCD